MTADFYGHPILNNFYGYPARHCGLESDFAAKVEQAFDRMLEEAVSQAPSEASAVVEA